MTGLVFLEAGLLDLIGALLGVLLGVFLAQGLASLTSSILNQDLGRIDIPPNVVVTSAMIGVVVTFLAAWMKIPGRTNISHGSAPDSRQNQSELINFVRDGISGWFSFGVHHTIDCESIPLRCSIPFGKHNCFWPF